MTIIRRKGLSGIFAALGLISTACMAQAQSQDSTFEGTQRLFRRAFDAAKETPLSQSVDASQVVTALRSTRDMGLLPLFDKLRESKVVDNQVFGMIAGAVLSKDSKRVDLKLLFSAKDPELVGSAVASLIDADFLTKEQLGQIISDAPDGTFKAMAAGELNHRKELNDRTVLLNLLKDDKTIVSYYAALTLLDGKDPAEISTALETLKKLTQKHELRDAPVQALMLVRAQKDNITAAAPWAAEVAGDPEIGRGTSIYRDFDPLGAQRGSGAAHSRGHDREAAGNHPAGETWADRD